MNIINLVNYIRKKYNLDEESLFMEFEDKVING